MTAAKIFCEGMRMTRARLSNLETDRWLYSAAGRDLEGMEPRDRFFGIWAKAVCVKKEGRPPKGAKMEKRMRLYEFAPTRSIRARWTLQELGVDFEAVTINLVA